MSEDFNIQPVHRDWDRELDEAKVMLHGMIDRMVVRNRMDANRRKYREIHEAMMKVRMSLPGGFLFLPPVNLQYPKLRKHKFATSLIRK